LYGFGLRNDIIKFQVLASVDFKLKLLNFGGIVIALTSNCGDFLAVGGYDSFGGAAGFATVLGSVSSSWCIGTLGANDEGWDGSLASCEDFIDDLEPVDGTLLDGTRLELGVECLFAITFNPKLDSRGGCKSFHRLYYISAEKSTLCIVGDLLLC
jgi:hypothetical protein